MFRYTRSQVVLVGILLLTYILTGVVATLYQVVCVEVADNITFLSPDFSELLTHNFVQINKNMILGILSLCLYSFSMLFSNSFAGGICVGYFIQAKNMSAFFTGFLPHAIFEIPAVLLSVGVPIIFYGIIFGSIRQKKSIFKYFLKEIKTKLVSVILLSYLLIIIAAIFESYISYFK